MKTWQEYIKQIELTQILTFFTSLWILLVPLDLIQFINFEMVAELN